MAPPGVLQGIFHAVGGELALDHLVRSAHSGAQGVSTLDHKSGDDAVEGQSVVEALAGQL